MKTARPLLPLLVLVAFVFAGCEEVYQDFYIDHHAGTSTGTSTSTGMGVCTPGEIAACYDGPAGTEGVGLCKPGSKTCGADGASFGPCAGAILPVVENCATPVDEDCDGLAPPCKGIHVWSKSFGDVLKQFATSIATDTSSNVLLTGAFSGSVNFGGDQLVSKGNQDVFVAKFDPSGTHVWSKSFGDASGQAGIGIVTDHSNNVFLIGAFSGSVNFGGDQLVSAGGDDVFVAKFDPSGTHVWSKSFGDSQNQRAQRVAVDSGGNVFLTGTFSGSVDFGGSKLVSVGGDDVFVAKFDPNGMHLWSKRFGDANGQAGIGMAVDNSDNVLLTGAFSGSVNFGGDNLVSAGGDDVFVAKLDPNGAHLWSKRFGDANGQTGISVSADSSGNVLLTGAFSGSVDFGGKNLVSAGGDDVFVAMLYPNGAHHWSKRFGDSSDQLAFGVLDNSGNVLLTGAFSGGVDLGGGQLGSVGGDDVFVAKLDPNGEHQWSKRFGDGMDQVVNSIAFDATGDVLLAGYFSGAPDLGGGPLLCAGDSDIFVAKFGQ